jgi:hypothetical protein
MPNVLKGKAIFIPGGDVDAMNESTLLHLGELGQEFDYNDKVYELVQFDTSCSSVAANQLAFWVDKKARTVTNVAASANMGQRGGSFRNLVAGIFRCSATALYYGCILKKGYGVYVKDLGTSYGGDLLVAASSTNADAVAVAMGTAPTHQVIGVAKATTAASKVLANIDINDTP